ncbi:DUF2614 family zinc ribbon-containing protein [Brevibacillus massiliensis]|jgi:hypothetical protein|uniref:DUF2614 family zinc ribbon-containing protein n=1 Tax=Brevibacillus massiliensis TaxID=1118054 RepID=UPI0002DE847C|nr:DUF2614 family zinc ribbon-containing protein [Brevibacillus massiliensis]
MKNTDRISKIKRLRTWGNWGMGISMVLMFASLAVFLGFRGQLFAHILLTIALLIGFILMMGSTVLFMISGMVSMTTPQVECPTCGKVTKMLGKEDACMFCGQPLLLPAEDHPSKA